MRGLGVIVVLAVVLAACPPAGQASPTATARVTIRVEPFVDLELPQGAAFRVTVPPFRSDVMSGGHGRNPVVEPIRIPFRIRANAAAVVEIRPGATNGAGGLVGVAALVPVAGQPARKTELLYQLGVEYYGGRPGVRNPTERLRIVVDGSGREISGVVVILPLGGGNPRPGAYAGSLSVVVNPVVN